MKRYNKTSSLKDLLENSVFNSAATKNKMTNVIKHSTVFSFWNNIVGLKFARHTKPYAIRANKIYVSAKSPAVIQELNLYKFKLLSKINTYSKPLGIEIKDIIFNYKNFEISKAESEVQEEDIPVELKNEEIENITMDNKTEIELREKIEKINFLNGEQKEKLLSKLISAKKAQIIQNKEINN